MDDDLSELSGYKPKKENKEAFKEEDEGISDIIKKFNEEKKSKAKKAPIRPKRKNSSPNFKDLNLSSDSSSKS